MLGQTVSSTGSREGLFTIVIMGKFAG